MRHWLYGLFISLLISTPLLSFAQDSLFDEGVYKEIRAEDITPEMAEWARSTADTLKRKLTSLSEVTLKVPEKRAELEQVIRDSVVETKDIRDLLLMRYHLNRTLELSSLFKPENSILAINYVLLPGIKRAIKLYENADLPYLMAHQVLPEGEIEPPAFAYFVKSYLPDLLTTAIFSPDPNHQLRVLKFGIVWTFHDLNRSLGRQNFGPLFKRLKEKFDEVKEVQSSNEIINSNLKQFILDTYEALPVEKEYEELLKLEKKEEEIKPDVPKQEASTFVPNFENGQVVLSHPSGADVEGLLMSPNNRYVASYADWYGSGYSRHKEIRLFDLLEKKEVANFTELSSMQSFEKEVGFISEGPYFYIVQYGGDYKYKLLLLNLRTREIHLLDTGDYVEGAKVSPSGKFMIVAGEVLSSRAGTVHLLTLRTKQIMKIIQFEPLVSDPMDSTMIDRLQAKIQIEISKDDEFIFAANKKALKVYDLHQGRIILEEGLNVEEGFETPIRNFVWDEVGKILYANSNTREGIIKKYDFSHVHHGNIPVSILTLSSTPSKMYDIDPQGRYAVMKKGVFSRSDSDSSTRAAKKGFTRWENESYVIIDPTTGNESWPGRFELFRIVGPILSSNGDFLFASYQLFTFEGKNKLFNVDKPTVYSKSWMNGRFLSDGDQFLTYTGEDNMKKYDLMRNEVKTLNLNELMFGKKNAHFIEAVVFSSNAQFILASSYDNENALRFWKVNW